MSEVYLLDDSEGLDDGVIHEPEQQSLPEDTSAIQEQEHSNRWRIFTIIIIIILLLLLLCPVNKETKKRVDRGRSRAAQAGPGEKKIGETAYRFLSGGPVLKFPGTRRFMRATPLRLSFTVRNLSYRSRNLGYAAMKITDEHNQTYRIHPDLTQRWYESRRLDSPWEKDIKGNQRLQVEAVFLVRKGPPKVFHLEGRDLDWQAVKYIEVGGGKYPTIFR